jgi:hypothetical protein
VAGQPAWSTWSSSHAGGRSGGVRLPPVVCSLAAAGKKNGAAAAGLTGGEWRSMARLQRVEARRCCPGAGSAASSAPTAAPPGASFSAGVPGPVRLAATAGGPGRRG